MFVDVVSNLTVATCQGKVCESLFFSRSEKCDLGQGRFTFSLAVGESPPLVGETLISRFVFAEGAK